MAKVFTVNGINYLGSQEKEVITGMQISGAVTDDVCANYFVTKASKELLKITVGANTDVITRDMTRRETVTYNSVAAEFDAAKDMAQDELVTIVFEKFRGKK